MGCLEPLVVGGGWGGGCGGVGGGGGVRAFGKESSKRARATHLINVGLKTFKIK